MVVAINHLVFLCLFVHACMAGCARRASRLCAQAGVKKHLTNISTVFTLDLSPLVEFDFMEPLICL